MSLTIENETQSTQVAGASRQVLIPQNVSALVNSSSNADECFINQRFSGKLQAFLIGYVATIMNGDGILVTNLNE